MPSEPKTLDDLFLDTLKDIYYAENQIYKSLPKMIDQASEPELRQGLEQHRAQTANHIKRLEQVFKQHGAEAKAVDCPTIDGILEEADEVAGEVADKPVMDAAIIAAAQAVEHYEMARYGTLRAWAQQLGLKDAVKLLEQTLGEEEKTDQLLTKLGMTAVNKQAA